MAGKAGASQVKCVEKMWGQCEGKDLTKSKLFEGYNFDEEGFSKLFHDLDVNNDGRIDAKELSEGLCRLGINHVPGQAQVS